MTQRACAQRDIVQRELLSCADCTEAYDHATDLLRDLEFAPTHHLPLATEKDALRVGLAARELARGVGLGSAKCQRVFIAATSLALSALGEEGGGQAELLSVHEYRVVRVTVSHRHDSEPPRSTRQSMMVETCLSSGLLAARRLADTIFCTRGRLETRLTAFFLGDGRRCTCTLRLEPD